jgi:hypothetical protein
VRVPAGDFVLSLAKGRDAPDLQRLTVPPGAEARAAYHPRSGWSLVVRCRTAAGGRPVAGTAVKLSETLGYGQPVRQIAQAEVDAGGLVLISGIGATLASLTAEHAGYLPAAATGLSAPAGKFAVAHLALAAGGRLRATVSLHGRPLNDAQCRLSVQTDSPFAESRFQLTRWKSQTDAQGVCRSIALPAGSYELAVTLPDATGEAYRQVSITEGGTTKEDLALASMRLSGTVRRGGKPAEGYEVRAMLSTRNAGAGGFTALSDADGNYEFILWTPGTYYLTLQHPNQIDWLAHQTVKVQEGDAPTQDFDLNAGSLHGRVIDQSGAPLAQAIVHLTQQHIVAGMAVTDQQGQFDIAFQGTGPASATASRMGYQASAAVPVQIDDQSTAPPPVTLVLTRQSTVRGVVVTADGAPAVGALVVAAAPGAGSGGGTRTDAAGRFEVAVPPGQAYLFLAGPGCPMFTVDLSSADTAVPAAGGDPDAGAAPADAGADPAGSGGAVAAGAPPGQVCQCPSPDQTGGIALTLLESGGEPASPFFMGFKLHRDGLEVPTFFLLQFLSAQGLPNHVNASGQLLIAGLSPAQYDFFQELPPASSAAASATVVPGSVVPLAMTLPARYLRRP